jgi:hypothetical protein
MITTATALLILAHEQLPIARSRFEFRMNLKRLLDVAWLSKRILNRLP